MWNMCVMMLKPMLKTSETYIKQRDKVIPPKTTFTPVNICV